MSRSTPAFFTELNYSSSVEDGRSELQALRLGPQDRVLAVTASGIRVLDLLLGDPAAIVAVDLNPAQNALLDLHLAAIATLDHDGWLRLLGVREDANRRALYGEVRPRMNPVAAAWFDARPSLIRRGPMYGGRWETYLRWMSYGGLPRRTLARRLFDSPDLPTQIALWERHWEGIPWRLLLDLLGWRDLWARLIDEPGIHLVDPNFYIPGYIHRRFRVLIQNTRLADSPYASLAFFGRHEYALPLALRPEHFGVLRARVGRVQWETTSLLDHLTRADRAAYSAFSLSDFSSYADPEEYRATWHAVRGAARPDARFCERQFLVKRTPPPVGLVREPDLEAALDRADDSFIYTFVCGRIP